MKGCSRTGTCPHLRSAVNSSQIRRQNTAFSTSLSDAFLASDRSIVFTQTIDSASKCSARLTQNGVPSEALHSELNKANRTQIFHRFAGGQLKVIVAPKLLDEGVDVPEADLGVIFAASQHAADGAADGARAPAKA